MLNSNEGNTVGMTLSRCDYLNTPTHSFLFPASCPKPLQWEGVLHVVAGATGLYAVSGDSVQAARVYMLSWPANFFLGLLVALQHPWSTEVDPAYKGLEITGSLMTGVQTVILVYYFKVSYLLMYEAPGTYLHVA